MFQPTVSGPDYVLSNDSTVFNLTFTDMIIENITATNCAIEFDSVNNTFTIANPTADVVVNIEAHGVPCWLYISGSSSIGASSHVNWAKWPNGGTITYTNIYGVTEVVDVSTISFSAFDLHYRKNDVLLGTDVVCNNITAYSMSSTAGPAWPVNMRFSNTDDNTYDYTKVLSNSSSTASYTFTNIQQCPTKFHGDVRIDC